MDKLAEAKSDFRILLRETKLITHKSRDLVNESERHYKDIITVLEVCPANLFTCVVSVAVYACSLRMTSGIWFWTV